MRQLPIVLLGRFVFDVRQDLKMKQARQNTLYFIIVRFYGTDRRS